MSDELISNYEMLTINTESETLAKQCRQIIAKRIEEETASSKKLIFDSIIKAAKNGVYENKCSFNINLSPCFVKINSEFIKDTLKNEGFTSIIITKEQYGTTLNCTVEW